MTIKFVFRLFLWNNNWSIQISKRCLFKRVLYKLVLNSFWFVHFKLNHILIPELQCTNLFWSSFLGDCCSWILLGFIYLNDRVWSTNREHAECQITFGFTIHPPEPFISTKPHWWFIVIKFFCRFISFDFCY